MNNKIVITTDSGLDPINTDTMVSGQITRDDGKSYRDLLEITPKEIIKDKEHVFKTASPLMGDYEDLFIKYLEEDYDIIHLSMSSGISEGSNNSANTIASILNDEYERKIYCINTLNGATGGTLINEYAKSLVEKGLPLKEIIEKLEAFKIKVKTSFFVPDPSGFFQSGRNKSEQCLKDKALLLGTRELVRLGLKVRVDFNDEGNLFLKRLLRGKSNITYLKLIKEIINSNNKEEYDDKYIVVGNLNKKDIDMENVKDYLTSLSYFKNIIEQDINGVVAAYGCDDLCGISLVKKGNF